MARYEPESPTTSLEGPALAAYLAQELRRIAESFLGVEEILLVELNVEPDKPRDGMIILVDGTNFNPGSGAGFYGRVGGAWTFLG
ncbi:hypothetical protein LCGC14_1852950 [marine sediment metagenome]|uniref:Uncharacterized protein n=1 Tax=marine sediment metagenome TaxID=412755 RepID=A0A0F9J8Z5_9ZZZZ